ncbi:MAG: ferrochelatase [Gemmatimonadales bacterium]
MEREPIAVLLMAYGGPLSLADVEPYLRDIRGGRPTSPALVEEVRARYARIGGRSPILELTQAQARGVGDALGPGFRVFVGMRHWHPYIAAAVEDIVAAGLHRVVGIVMAPHYAGMSVGAYETQLLQAADGRLDTALVRSWWAEPPFLEAIAGRIIQALQRFPRPAGVAVIFSAHSLPQRILAAGDPYPEELRASAAEVAQRARLAPEHWQVAYQSAGATPEPWLGPDVSEVIEKLSAQGRDAALLVPIGFVCDHVEILYDVDIEYQEVARRLGIRLERTASLNDDAGLVAAVAGVAQRTVRQKGWL